MAEFRWAIALRPFTPRVYYERAQALRYLGEPELATADMKTVRNLMARGYDQMNPFLTDSSDVVGEDGGFWDELLWFLPQVH